MLKCVSVESIGDSWAAELPLSHDYYILSYYKDMNKHKFNKSVVIQSGYMETIYGGFLTIVPLEIKNALTSLKKD